MFIIIIIIIIITALIVLSVDAFCAGCCSPGGEFPASRPLSPSAA
jgi:hypothetical protein